MNKIFKFMQYFSSAPTAEAKDILTDIDQAAESFDSPDMVAQILMIIDQYCGQLDLAQFQLPVDDIHRTMHDLPIDFAESLKFLAIRKIVNNRMKHSWYENRFFFLVCSEKSSSTFHEIFIRKLLIDHNLVQPTAGIQRGVSFGHTELASGSSIHGLLPMYFPNGDLVRGPYLPTPGNFALINELKAKTILLCRHPADRLVASGCMISAADAPQFEKDLENGTAFLSLIKDYFAPSLRSLNNDLNWMAGWLLKFSGSADFQLLKYENLMQDRHAHFNTIAQFLIGKPMSTAQSDDYASILNDTLPTGKAHPGGHRSYPRGHTGKVGIWKSYLSPLEIECYNETVANFLKYHPGGKLMLEIYPDLLLD